jgi:hypothetical protein
MIEAPVGQMEGRRRPLRPGNVLVTLEDLLIVTWRRDPAQMARRLPGGLVPVEHGGAAYSSALLFRNRALRPVPFGFPRFSGPQVNVRSYVVDPITAQPGAVYFHSLELDAQTVSAFSRALFRVPFGHRSFAIESSRHPARWSAQGDGVDIVAAESSSPHPFAPALIDLWSNSHSGYFATASGRLKGWSIWHRPQMLRSMALEKFSLAPAARIGLEGIEPVSVYLVDSIDYEVYLPPRTIPRT